ncbi:MAG: ACP phosphodiesterase [Crocinitomicaceae bacterium]|nr:ACP phosphodiesterase [Crocinitomicaceae bacterium]
MNFLGHLYFSDNKLDLMYANLFGDFVKGKDLSEFSQLIQDGVHLHRNIDSYIDHHPIVIELLHHLYPFLPKISGIAVDIIFDHLLSVHWDKYHNTDRKEFIDNFYNHEIKRDFGSDYFWVVIDKMKEGQWLHKYNSIEGLNKACSGLSNRISFPNVLDQAPRVYLENKTLFEKTFHAFMKEAVIHFDDYISKNIKLNDN